MPKYSKVNIAEQLCSSASHRSIMGLLATALGETTDLLSANNLAELSPELIAQIANNNQIHTLIKTAFDSHPELIESFPEDLYLYFKLIYSANKTRNEEAKVELELLGKLFSEENIEVVILKGGAEIVSPLYIDPAHRFISDLDILVPEHNIQKAAQLLFLRGGTSNPMDDKNFQNHHHLPVIEGDALPFRIELHKSIGGAISNSILSPDEIFKDSLQSDIKGINVPSYEHRFIHHIIHGQIESQLYERNLLNLRNCCDHYYFRQKLEAQTLQKAYSKLSEHSLLHLSEGMDALCEWIFAANSEQRSAVSNPWAKTAIRNFGRPDVQKHIDSAIWLKTYFTNFIRDPKMRKHYIRKLLSARGWKQFIAFHKDRLKRFR